MTPVKWTPALLGRFTKAIAAAREARDAEFDFTVDTTHGQATVRFSVDYAEYLADFLSTSFAADAAVQ